MAEEGSLATVSVRPEGASSSAGWTGIIWTVLSNFVSGFYDENDCIERKMFACSCVT